MGAAWIAPLSLLAALACALVAGLFLGFSSFVMRALGERPPAEGVAAMQAINRVILRSAFIALFLLATLLAAALDALEPPAHRGRHRRRRCLRAGAARLAQACSP